MSFIELEAEGDIVVWLFEGSPYALVSSKELQYKGELCVNRAPAYCEECETLYDQHMYVSARKGEGEVYCAICKTTSLSFKYPWSHLYSK